MGCSDQPSCIHLTITQLPAAPGTPQPYPHLTLLTCSPLPPPLQSEAQQYLSSDCPEYLRKAEKRLAEEVERVANYLDPSTEAKILKVVDTELVLNQVRG
jgi:hypothetical protein